MATSLEILNIVLLATVALAALGQWAARRDAAQADTAFLFTSLAIGLVAFEFGPPGSVLAITGLVLILAFPVLLIRVVRQFRRVPVGVQVAAWGGMALSWVLVGVAVQFGVGLERLFSGAAVIAITAYLAGSSLYAGVAFARGAGRSRGVPRRRMTIAATGIVLLAAAAVLALLPRYLDPGGVVSQASQLAVTGSFLALFLGFTPPHTLLRGWQANEFEGFLRATGETGTDSGVSVRLCQAADRVLGGRNAFVVLRRGEVAASDADPDLLESVRVDAAAWVEVLSGVDRPLQLPAEDLPITAPGLEGHRLAIVPVKSRRRQGTLVVPFDHRPLFLDETILLLHVLGQQTARVLELHDIAGERERLIVERYRRERETFRRERQALEESSRLKSEFLANMSHELRTPLNSILGFTELLRSGKVGKTDDQAREFLDDILVSARHLTRLINDVLDLAKVEAGKIVFEPMPVDVQEVCDEVVTILRTTIAEKDHDVRIDVNEEVRIVVIDPTRLKQVVYNFLSNAIKFTPPGGRIRVRLAAMDAAYFHIEVKDNGIGIAKEDQGRLFREFEQLEAGRAKQHQGTGLGLALVQRLVEAQGGYVGVESRLGEGSRFFAVLPRHHKAHRTGTGTPSRGIQAGPRILVVEDDVDDRERIVEALETDGYNVDAVGTLQAATARLAAAPYDGVILDLILPDGSGGDVLRRMRSDGPNRAIPVIVVSVVPEDEVGLAFEVQGYLAKPLRLTALRTAIREALPAWTKRPVLLVDDDERLLEVVQRNLEAVGVRVRTATDGTTAMHCMRRELPSLVVLDLIMPGMDGFAFLHWLRSTPGFQTVPVVVWTHKDLSPDERARLQQAAQAVLTKAGGGQGLVEVLQKALRPSEAEETEDGPGPEDAQTRVAIGGTP